MYTDIFRKLIGLVLWAVLCAVWAGLALWLALTNYQSLVSALELWNVEKKGIGSDELLGQFLGGILGDASLVHGFAFALAAGISGALFLACKTLFDIWNARDDRAEYRRLGDIEQEHNIGVAIRKRTRELLMIAIPLVGAIYLDIELFIYRSLNATAGIDDPVEAAAGTLHWSAIPADAMNNFAANLALHAGPIGYIALTALVSFLLEVAFQRANETFGILSLLFDGVMGGEGVEQQQVSYKAVHTETPVQQGAQELPVQTVTPSTTDSAEQQTDATEEDSASQENAAEQIAVIGGADGDSVTLSDAQSDSQRYYVDVATRSVWDRAHWEAIHGVDQYEQKRKTA